MGSGLSKLLIGGALGGLGTGMVERAEEKRSIALKLIEEQARDRREAEDRNFRAAENEKEREHRSGLISTVDRAEDGTAIGVTGGGDIKELGYTKGKSASQLREERLAAKGSGNAFGGISAADDRVIKRVIERNTTTKDDVKKVDWEAVDKTLRENGREDLADYLTAQDTGPEIDVESAAWKESDRAARALAEERKGLLSSRDEEFPETNGSEQEFINLKRMEMLRQIQGGQGGPIPNAAQSGATDKEPNTQSASGFKTKEEVRDAYKQRKITLEEARRILADEFGGR